MAGSYIEILNPGYSTLWTRDLPYAAGSGDAAAVNPFNPTDDRPLVEGEWLQRTGSDRVTRGGDNVTTVSGTPDGEGTSPAFLYFQEKGRYDAQMSRRAHIIIGPSLFEFRTRLCRSSGLAVGDKVSVWDWDGTAGAYGLTRRVLAAQVGAGAYVVGYVTRIFDTDDISVLYCPGHLA